MGSVGNERLFRGGEGKRREGGREAGQAGQAGQAGEAGEDGCI